MKKYKAIKEILQELASIDGFVINPLSLQSYILEYLRKKYPKDKNNATKARNASQVFANMCNEFYLIGLRQQKIKEFYITPERWEIYNVKQRMLETATKILKELNLIKLTYHKTNTDAYSHIKLYCINLNRLYQIRDEILEQ